MATTPEGKIKKLVSTLLSRTPQTYYHMPVPGGYGGTTLDYIGCNRGRAFLVETKRTGGRPTLRQEVIIAQARAAGAQVFVIDGPDGVAELEEWLLK